MNMNVEGWVRASIEDVKKKQLEILEYIREFCEEKGIKFFLMYGTLLGAVRHKGYIPWDDDIDIAMLRADYDRFIREFRDESGRFLVRDRSIDEEFPYYFAKIVDTTTRSEEIIDNKAFDLGINIDLFPLDDIPSDEKMKNEMFEKVYSIRNKMIFRTIDKNIKRVWYKRLIIWFMDHMALRRTYKYCWAIQRVVEKYSKIESNEVFEMMSPYGKKSVLPKQYFENTTMLVFEDKEFPVPREYDAILTKIYGDYMTPPPKEKQVTHHSYTAYIRK